MFRYFSLLAVLFCASISAANSAQSVMKQPEMPEFLAKRLIPPALSESPAEFNAYVEAESKRWTRIIRENRVSID